VIPVDLEIRVPMGIRVPPVSKAQLAIKGLLASRDRRAIKAPPAKLAGPAPLETKVLPASGAFLESRVLRA
jgi:hypothetical protein